MAQRINENTLQIVNSIGTDGYVRLVGSDGVSYRITVQALLNVINEQLEIDEIKEDIGDLSELETEDKSSLVDAINEAAQSGGSGSGGIAVVSLASEMTNTSSVYLYNGTEAGYTAGHWYFYNTGTSAWTDGGQYTGWETVETALATYLQNNAQTLGTLTINEYGGASLGSYNGTTDVTLTLPENSSSGVSSVTVTPTLESGTAIASIDVDGTSTTLYAPSGGSSGGSTLTWSTIADVDFSTTNSQQTFSYTNLSGFKKIVIVTFTPVSESSSDSRSMLTLNGISFSSNNLFTIYKSGTTYYTTNTVLEWDGKFWWISHNSDRNTSSTNTHGDYGTWQMWKSPIETVECTSLSIYCLQAPVSGSMHIYGGA